MKTSKALAAGLVVMLAASPLAFAQSDHKGHHPGGAAPKAEPAPQHKGGMGGGGQMSPDHMKQMHDMHAKKMGGGMGMAPKGDTGPASQAFVAANAKMHEQMDITFTGDADIDFAKGMIAHHEGAIDMAKVVLQYGKDEKMRKLAEDIIKAQGPEIALMTEWLKSKGH